MTIDLTRSVAEEAIKRKDSIIIAYRVFNFSIMTTYTESDIPFIADPIIFKGLKSLTLANSQQQSLLRLAANGISVSIVLSTCIYETALTSSAGLLSSYSL